MKNLDNTIAAIATPTGVGGVSIVRVSGKDALKIASKIFHSPLLKDITSIKPRYMYLGDVKTMNFTDKSLFVYFQAPHSYTGEDVIEFQCHGGTVIARGILEELLNNGATLASPGEFTKRAYINGCLTLDAAEGVIDMINAESEAEVRAGYGLLEGALAIKIKEMQKGLTQMLAKIEVTLDYPEVDYEEQTSAEILVELKKLETQLQGLIDSSKTGRLLKEGTKILILGRPNVGKSSLLNAMLNYSRAIVTDIEGTTRDIIEETYVYNGAKFVIIDTAGIRDSGDVIEQMGIEKAKSLINQSDVILLTLDASQGISAEDKNISSLLAGKNIIVVVNKADLISANSNDVANSSDFCVGRLSLDGNSSPDVVSNSSFDYTVANANPAVGHAGTGVPSAIDLKIQSCLDFEDFKAHNIRSIVNISAKNNAGIDNLKDVIYNTVIDDKVVGGNLVITNMRHINILQQALSVMKNAINAIVGGFSLDLVAIDINNLWQILGEITGETNSEDIIDAIFASFCLGK